MFLRELTILISMTKWWISKPAIQSNQS